MQLDKLQLDLRPRSNAQALDLGFTLLRAHAGATYLSWLVLWLPLVALCGVLACFLPDYSYWCLLFAWWLRPLLERAPLYVLSRQVFGEQVTWIDAVRAWPSQLAGGWLPLLTWWRPFAAIRNLHQPIFQLEGARGTVAAERRQVIGKNGTARSAKWFSSACAIFESVLQLGVIAFIGIFVSNERSPNPFAYFAIMSRGHESVIHIFLLFLAYAFSGAILGPVYTACGFTLYLNRRATLEAWDIEIVLRQIKRPSHKMASIVSPSVLMMIFGFGIVTTTLLQPNSVFAADNVVPVLTEDKQDNQCEIPNAFSDKDVTRQPDQGPVQKELRRQLVELYQTPDLQNSVCKNVWRRKDALTQPLTPKQKFVRSQHDEHYSQGDMTIAVFAKSFLIAAAIGCVVWVLYRYRDQLSAWAAYRPQRKATEIAGMDIRPESLPDDVATSVGKLWAQGQQRAALALLYRATISRLVNQDHLKLTQGATEGDCMRLADQALHLRQLAAGRQQITRLVTDLWVHAAYADRWPDDAQLADSCIQWRTEFDAAAIAGSSKVAS